MTKPEQLGLLRQLTKEHRQKPWLAITQTKCTECAGQGRDLSDNPERCPECLGPNRLYNWVDAKIYLCNEVHHFEPHLPMDLVRGLREHGVTPLPDDPIWEEQFPVDQ